MPKQHNKKDEIKDAKKNNEDIDEKIVVQQEDEISILKQQADEYLDGWKRLQAEFENYKKRQAESQRDMIKYAAQNIVLQIIPVIDNFHMSTEHVPEDQKENPWVVGIMYIQKQLEAVLADNGVQQITAHIGDAFDPVYHEAVHGDQCSCSEEECKEPKKYKNRISKVLMAGYKMEDRVIRPARVVVE